MLSLMKNEFSTIFKCSQYLVPGITNSLDTDKETKNGFIHAGV